MSYLNTYQDLKFNLDLDETLVVADKTRELCKYDVRAFYFLTNYILISLNNL